jgi:hypothetical protein
MIKRVMMEQKFEFIEISLLKDDNQLTYTLKEKEFYEWLRKNSKENILSVPVLKYKIDKEEYIFKVERSKIPILNKWDAQSTYQKTNTPSLNFTFDWKRDPDFRLDFERKLKAELEKVADDSICVCKQRTLSKEMVERNSAVSNLRI